MADSTRSPKSGCDWTLNELIGYNIKITPQSPDTFYGTPLPTLESLTTLDPHLFSGTLETQGLSDETYRVLQYLFLASEPNLGQDSAIHDFVKEILRVFGYENRDRLLRSYYAIPLLVCYDQKEAHTDMSLVHKSSTIVLVVKEENTLFSYSTEAQLIAGAIAAFQMNNRTRRNFGEPKLDSMTVPCIMMNATRPTFYLVPVTEELSVAVALGQYPLSCTVVKKCVVPPASNRMSECMDTPNYRHLALRHFSAFCALAEVHWSSFIIPQ
jgi:hypothetical protein